MKYILIICALHMSLIGIAQSEEITVPFSQPSEKKSLDIQLFGGEIKIIGTDRKDILIRYEIEKRQDDDDGRFPVHPRDEKRDGLKKIGGGNFEFEIGESNNEVYMRSQNFMNIIRVEMEVPKNISIDISKQMGQDVLVQQIKGNVNIENNIGNITVEDFSGAVNASTSNGEIKIEFADISENHSMSFNTITGNIDVTFPLNHNCDLKMRTEWGDIYSDLDIKLKEDDKPKLDNAEGGMKVISNSWTLGSLNDGGKELTMKTKMGNIYLRAKK